MITRMHIEVNEQRGTCVPGVMNGDRAHSRRLAARRELPVESARIDGSAITAGEHQRRKVLRLLPDLASSLSFLILAARA